MLKWRVHCLRFLPFISWNEKILEWKSQLFPKIVSFDLLTQEKLFSCFFSCFSAQLCRLCFNVLTQHVAFLLFSVFLLNYVFCVLYALVCFSVFEVWTKENLSCSLSCFSAQLYVLCVLMCFNVLTQDPAFLQLFCSIGKLPFHLCRPYSYIWKQQV